VGVERAAAAHRIARQWRDILALAWLSRRPSAYAAPSLVPCAANPHAPRSQQCAAPPHRLAVSGLATILRLKPPGFAGELSSDPCSAGPVRRAAYLLKIANASLADRRFTSSRS
jgi:hypothetical protein